MTVLEKDRLAEEEKIAESNKQKIEEERKKESHDMVEEEIRKELAAGKLILKYFL